MPVLHGQYDLSCLLPIDIKSDFVSFCERSAAVFFNVGFRTVIVLREDHLYILTVILQG